jgi:dimeric dUTPase (all-alpha-NTP-PPase superfamily)
VAGHQPLTFDVAAELQPDGHRRVGRGGAGSRVFLATGRPAPSLAAMDKLEEIFQMQDALNRRIGVNLPPATEEEKAKWILNYTRALQQETAELIDSVPWKWWAKYQKFDEQNAKVEVVDLFHFLVSLAQTLGMTADDVYQAYLKKNAVNHARQESGYGAKDEADSKHI